MTSFRAYVNISVYIKIYFANIDLDEWLKCFYCNAKKLRLLAQILLFFGKSKPMVVNRLHDVCFLF